MWRQKRFKSFLQQLIESNKGNYTKQCQQNKITKCMPSFKDVQLKFIDSMHIHDINDLLLKCVSINHVISHRKYGNINFIEHQFS